MDRISIVNGSTGSYISDEPYYSKIVQAYKDGKSSLTFGLTLFKLHPLPKKNLSNQKPL